MRLLKEVIAQLKEYEKPDVGDSGKTDFYFVDLGEDEVILVTPSVYAEAKDESYAADVGLTDAHEVTVFSGDMEEIKSVLGTWLETGSGVGVWDPKLQGFFLAPSDVDVEPGQEIVDFYAVCSSMMDLESYIAEQTHLFSDEGHTPKYLSTESEDELYNQLYDDETKYRDDPTVKTQYNAHSDDYLVEVIIPNASKEKRGDFYKENYWLDPNVPLRPYWAYDQDDLDEIIEMLRGTGMDDVLLDHYDEFLENFGTTGDPGKIIERIEVPKK